MNVPLSKEQIVSKKIDFNPPTKFRGERCGKARGRARHGQYQGTIVYSSTYENIGGIIFLKVNNAWVEIERGSFAPIIALADGREVYDGDEVIINGAPYIARLKVVLELKDELGLTNGD